MALSISWRLRILTLSMLLSLAAAWMVIDAAIKAPFAEDLENFASIRDGMTVQEVVDRLGTPDKIVYADSAVPNYYVSGYSYKRRPITYMVYVYLPGEPIAYVYFDRDKRVEEIFVGGS